MIKLGRYPGPDLLADPYVANMRRRLWDYLRRSPDERRQRRAPIDEAFFYEGVVRHRVQNRCLGKCVFCERDVRFEQQLVDHYRPLRDARGLDGRPDWDHYAWLAYEPDNLILICRTCHHAKETHFPVARERAPYLAPLSEVRRREEPLLVDPYRGQPDRHFTFLTNGACVPNTLEGRVTVALLRLNRPQLINERAADMSRLGEELRSAFHERSRIADIFDRSRPFAGARLSLLRRLIEGITIEGQRVEGSSLELPRNFFNALAFASNLDHDRLATRLDDIFRADVESVIPGEPYPPPETLGWSNRELNRARVELERTGGLANVKLKNFKAHADLSLFLLIGRERSKSTPCLMLLGENAVGKSSVLQGIALALIGGREARRLRVDPSDFLRAELDDRWDQLAPTDAIVEAEFRFSGVQAHFAVEADRRRIVGSARPACLVLGYGPRRFFDARKSERAAGAYSRVQTLFSATATIPYPGTWLNELTPERFHQVAKVMRVVLALDDEDELTRDLDGRICVSVAGQPVPIERLSEGYRSTFVMVADIVRELLAHHEYLENAEAVVLIDEIETHLHPRWKMRVMTALRRALPSVQFIVTTHDPLCLRGMDDGEVVVLQRDASGRIVMLEGLPSIKGMRADQLLTSDYFGLSSTIDPETELGIARFAAAVQDLPQGRGSEANNLINHLTLGDDAQEQVMQEALRRFIEQRDRPARALRPDVRAEAVRAVLDALSQKREPSAR